MSNGEKRRGLWIDPRTKILLLLLCVLSATMAPSLLYEMLIVALVACFGIVCGKVRYSIIGVIVYGGFYLLTQAVLQMPSGNVQVMLIAFLGLVHKVYPCGILSGIILSLIHIFKRIFYRCGSQLDMPGISPKHQENIRIALQKETLVVSLGAKLKNARLRSVWKWFEKNDVADFGKPFENFVISNQLPEGFVDNEAVQADVVRYFSTFDSSIIGFDVEKIDKGEDDDQDRYKIYAIHKMIGKDDVVKIPLKQESAGTLKMFALYPIPVSYTHLDVYKRQPMKYAFQKRNIACV